MNLLNQETGEKVLLMSSDLTLLKRKDAKKGKLEIDGAYLAGLIEGDGCIYVPKENKKNRRRYPLISITFHRNELKFMERLLEWLGTGFIYLRKDSKGGDIRIGTVEGVKRVINKIKGYMRTPKIESLNAAIDFINDQRGLKIRKRH